MDTGNTKALLNSALEHFAHGWRDLQERGIVHMIDPNVFPPEVSDAGGTVSYHLAAMAWYLQMALDSVDDRPSLKMRNAPDW